MIRADYHHDYKRLTLQTLQTNKTQRLTLETLQTHKTQRLTL